MTPLPLEVKSIQVVYKLYKKSTSLTFMASSVVDIIGRVNPVLLTPRQVV